MKAMFALSIAVMFLAASSVYAAQGKGPGARAGASTRAAARSVKSAPAAPRVRTAPVASKGTSAATKGASSASKKGAPAGGADSASAKKSVPGKDLMTVLKNANDLTTFASLLQKGNMLKTVEKGGPYTLFAPSDDAFKSVAKDKLDAIIADKDKLAALLKGLIAPTRQRTVDLMYQKEAKMLNGDTRPTSCKEYVVHVEEASITKKDMEYDCGIIQEIDTVLMPKVMPEPKAPEPAKAANAPNMDSTGATAAKGAAKGAKGAAKGTAAAKGAAKGAATGKPAVAGKQPPAGAAKGAAKGAPKGADAKKGAPAAKSAGGAPKSAPKADDWRPPVDQEPTDK